MHNDESNIAKRYRLKDFLPIVIIVLLTSLFTFSMQLLYGFDMHRAMSDFMGSNFVVFSVFKIMNLQGFAESYSMYDIIAKRFKAYAYLYPFIELALGIAYLAHYQSMVVNLVTVVLMGISSVGVLFALREKKAITCACLGAVFKIPMTYVTLVEDLVMGIMALAMMLATMSVA